MIGGYYVLATDQFEGKTRTSLVAGPFTTWAEADKAGPTAINYVNDKLNGKDKGLSWTICQFFAPALVSGMLNTELWTKPTPTERNE